MTNRERILKILNGQKSDRVPWFGDLSYWINYLRCSGKLPEKYKGKGEYLLYRDIGSGFYLQGYWPFKPVYEGNVNVQEKEEVNRRITRVETPVGSIQEVWTYLPESYTWGPSEYYVKHTDDLKVVRYWYESIHYEPDYTLAQDRIELVGDNGVVLCYLPRSPFMHMVVKFAGIEAMTYAFMDDENELNQTIKVLRNKADEAAKIALESPAECLMIPENLSSEVIGKNFFESYMRDYEENWNRRISKSGKYSFVHMDGTLKGLIKEVSSTGFRVLEALTPSPVGDIEFQDIHKYVPGDNIIWGGLPGTFFADTISDEEFDDFVIGVLEVMKSEPTRYVLGVADQVPPYSRWDKIARVSQLVEKFGRY
jgi:hypothetical protein